MSKAGKFLFSFAVLFFLGLLGFRYVYGGWQNSMWVPLGLSVALFIAGVFKDWRAIRDFFAMRTTKHGLNVGALIIIALVGLACVNFLAVRYEKKFDWTSEKLNSLSDQSIKAARGLKADTEFTLLYRNDQSQGESVQRAVQDLLSMYQNVAPKLKYSAYNALQHPELAKKFEYTTGSYAFFVAQGETHVRIDQPTEEGVTRALLKLGHEKKKVIYFTRGHGERDLSSSQEEGLSQLKQDLSVTYEPKDLVLFEAGNKVPDDAGVVAVIRPQAQFLDVEIQALRDYAKRGGKLWLCIDPGFRQNLAQLTKSIGVEFSNDYVLDLRSQVIRGGPATVLGTVFSSGNEITRAFNDGSYVVFHLASSLRKASETTGDAKPDLTVEEIVRTPESTMNIAEIRDKVEYKANGPHTIAMLAKGKLSGSTKEFAAVVVGDSDFISNALFQNNLNRDFAINSVASLAQDTDLISIRPKQPKGTRLEMTAQSVAIFVLGILLPIPVLLFLSGGVMWWRRRTA